MLDVHISTLPSEKERVAMEMRVLAFIFPNKPRTPEECAAFAQAVEIQIIHEKSILAQIGGSDIPAGVKSFSIGDFSMTFEDGAFSSPLTRKSICPTAYGLLLKSGMLYKGVERL